MGHPGQNPSQHESHENRVANPFHQARRGMRTRVSIKSMRKSLKSKHQQACKYNTQDGVRNRDRWS